MNALVRLDSFIIDRIYQRIADWIGRRFGKSCYEAAALCGYGVIFAIGLAPLLIWIAMGLWDFVPIGILGLVIPGWYGSDMHKRGLRAHRAMFESQNPTLPFDRLLVAPRFVVVVLGFGGSLFGMAWCLRHGATYDYLEAPFMFAHGVIYSSFYYFMACLPKPPARQKQEKKAPWWQRVRVPVLEGI
ncbi:MAG: hypothetical protein KGL39_03950 [Patescibacteria group bacterium]|nr:hypothetical protein [Patescibacteria group bacterium]